MNLSTMEQALRLDLFDPTGAEQRWSSTDLQRALEKAVQQYSLTLPYQRTADIATIANQRTYPYPTAYPVWWIERILYPFTIDEYSSSSCKFTASHSSQTLTLLIADHELPHDSSHTIRVIYASKHQLTASSSTIPEAHQELILLGAAAYAMEAYQVPTNDNFSFQDSSLKDGLDDTHIPKSWAATANQKMRAFQQALTNITDQQEGIPSTHVHWGTRSRSWSRL